MTWVKNCIQCGVSFEASGPAGMYCSKSCGQKYRYTHNMRTTEYQYLLVSGNWNKYYLKRLSEKGRSKTITLQEILDIHKRQDGKCALSGVELTCQLQKGTPCFTNASLDRIVAGGPYTADNVQLVCVGINRLRGNLSQSEYIDWCRKVVEHNSKE